MVGSFSRGYGYPSYILTGYSVKVHAHKRTIHLPQGLSLIRNEGWLAALISVIDESERRLPSMLP